MQHVAEAAPLSDSLASFTRLQEAMKIAPRGLATKFPAEAKALLDRWAKIKGKRVGPIVAAAKK
jgi:hypothetical protein